MHFWDQHKNITNYYEKLTSSICQKYKLTQLEYDILMFLYNNPKYNTASDIVRIRKSTKSHVSKSLKNLENKKLIFKKQNKENRKYYEIFLLEKANIIIQNGKKIQEQFIEDLFEGISEGDMVIFKKVFDKICKNADFLLKS